MSAKVDVKTSERNNKRFYHRQSSTKQESSTVSSRMEDTEDGGAAKKQKTESTGQVEEEVEETQHDKCSINNLPTEILMKILKMLDIKTLLFGRLTNRKWNGVASELCLKREDLQVKFKWCSSSGIIHWKNGERTLENFLNFFGDSDSESNSSSFLYTRFLIEKVEVSTFDDEHWLNFLARFKKSIKCLKLDMSKGADFDSDDLDDEDELIIFTAKIRRLLLNRLPTLQEFGVRFKSPTLDGDAASKIRLFTKSGENSNPLKNSIPQSQIRLPHLKVLHVHEHNFPTHKGIITDLFQAAVNLQKIEPFETCFSGEILKYLVSLGKLHCVQTLELDFCPEMVSEFTEKVGPVPTEFKLKDVVLFMQSIYGDSTCWENAAIFLKNLFETSKDTLEDLHLDPLGFLHEFGFQFPICSKLSALGIYADLDDLAVSELIPPGIKLSDVFPVLKSLELEIPQTISFLHTNCSPGIPTLTSLTIKGENMTETTIAQIALMCPNLTKFTIEKGLLSEKGRLNNFAEVGRAIWTFMKQLRSLDLKINVDARANAFPAVDSCITGFSVEDCERLYDLTKAENLLKKWGSQIEVPLVEFHAEKQHVSISELKDLKKLTIELFGLYKVKDGPGPDLTKKALTFISEDYTLKLMENLEYKIERRIKQIETDID